MNPFFYESIAKEKIKNLQEEGKRSQAFHRSRTSKFGFLPSWPRLFIGILTIFGIVVVFGR